MISDKTLEKRLNVIRRNWTCCAAIMYGHSIHYLAGLYDMPAQTLKNCIVHCIRSAKLVEEIRRPTPVSMLDALKDKTGISRRSSLTAMQVACQQQLSRLLDHKFVTDNGFKLLRNTARGAYSGTYVRVDCQRFFTLQTAVAYLSGNRVKGLVEVGPQTALDGWFNHRTGKVNEKAFD